MNLTRSHEGTKKAGEEVGVRGIPFRLFRLFSATIPPLHAAASTAVETMPTGVEFPGGLKIASAFYAYLHQIPPQRDTTF
jgi:hypothetical protein